MFFYLISMVIVNDSSPEIIKSRERRKTIDSITSEILDGEEIQESDNSFIFYVKSDEPCEAKIFYIKSGEPCEAKAVINTHSDHRWIRVYDKSFLQTALKLAGEYERNEERGFLGLFPKYRWNVSKEYA